MAADSDHLSRRMFRYSILFLLFAALSPTTTAAVDKSFTFEISPMSRFALKRGRIPNFWVGVVVGLALVGLVCAVV